MDICFDCSTTKKKVNSRKNKIKKNHKLEQRKLQTFFQVKKKPDCGTIHFQQTKKKSLITMMMTDMKQKMVHHINK